jgi:hypothetical protein
MLVLTWPVAVTVNVAGRTPSANTTLPVWLPTMSARRELRSKISTGRIE